MTVDRSDCQLEDGFKPVATPGKRDNHLENSYIVRGQWGNRTFHVKPVEFRVLQLAL